jgi:hypothetical protein
VSHEVDFVAASLVPEIYVEDEHAVLDVTEMLALNGREYSSAARPGVWGRAPMKEKKIEGVGDAPLALRGPLPWRLTIFSQKEKKVKLSPSNNKTRSSQSR